MQNTVHLLLFYKKNSGIEFATLTHITFKNFVRFLMSPNHITNSRSKVEASAIEKQEKIITVSEIKRHPTKPLNVEANEITSIASRWNLTPIASGQKMPENEE